MATAVPTYSLRDHSTTNVQAEGVGEAGFVKNDEKYICTIPARSIVMTDPAGYARINEVLLPHPERASPPPARSGEGESRRIRRGSSSASS